MGSKVTVHFLCLLLASGGIGRASIVVFPGVADAPRADGSGYGSLSQFATCVPSNSGVVTAAYGYSDQWTWNPTSPNWVLRAVRFGAAGFSELVQPFFFAPGGNTEINASNSAGMSVGMNNGVPFCWDTDGTVRALSMQDTATGQTFEYARPTAINKNGFAVGGVLQPVQTAVLWNLSDGRLTQLTPPLADPYIDTSSAMAINANGMVAGSVVELRFNRMQRVAARWSAGSSVGTPLGHLGYGSVSTNNYASAINEAGVAVGQCDRFIGGVFRGPRAVRWDAQGTAAVALEIPVSLPEQSRASKINEAGYILGASYDSSRSYDIRWSPGQTMGVLLPALPNAPTNGPIRTRANSMNNDNVIVGYSIDATSHARAVLWRDDLSILDINTLLPAGSGWELWRCFGVSDTGFVAGEGARDSIKQSFVILIPEAGTYGRGDANFDTHINFDDLLIVASHYGETNTEQDIHVGDLNLDGSVNFDDLLALAQHYGTGASMDDVDYAGDFASDWALARSMLPEPMSIVGLGGLLALRRRRAV